MIFGLGFVMLSVLRRAVELIAIIAKLELVSWTVAELRTRRRLLRTVSRRPRRPTVRRGLSSTTGDGPIRNKSLSAPEELRARVCSFSFRQAQGRLMLLIWMLQLLLLLRLLS